MIVSKTNFCGMQNLKKNHYGVYFISGLIKLKASGYYAHI